MQIIHNGMVEIHTKLDNGVEFIIERLYRGSVLNHKTFITEDKIDVNASCRMPVTLFYILLSDIQKIKAKCPYLQKKMDDVEIILINKDNSIALDYIISRDPAVTEMKHKRGKIKKDQFRRDMLTVKLKNAVMYHVVKLKI